MGKKTEKGKGYYAVYKTVDQCKKNRVKSLKRHLKAYPNDAQAKKALENPAGYVRATPKSTRWNAASKEMAQLEAKLKRMHNTGIKFDPDPRYVNWGVEVVEAKAPVSQKKSSRRKQKQKKEAA